ncbi:hypothetical protein LTT66_18185 [Nocardia gipuzkoensis]|uniref:hypothetical protein n=1 Tax=Nocardia gipuzkoensis TaxID=2749991 RepID=UPI001E634147|nr:hypothetical protein [Nocardia gipuzkoensis]UGT65299.1 hypothetical protein LTT66_18185 [Nocardia gipuzkoensis]
MSNPTEVDALKEFLLAQCDADKALPDSAVEAVRAVVNGWCDPFGRFNASEADAARAEKHRVLVRLARIWQFHPDFRPEWAPAEEGSQA